MSEDGAKAAQPEANVSKPQGQFAIQKMYVKDVSFEAPNAPQVFMEKWQPNVDVQISNTGSRLDENTHEVVLTVTITVRVEEKTAYLVEVQQAGIFNIVGVPPEQIGPILNIGCSNILFPFARETVSDLVTRGGFPQLLLAPVNFEVLYAQQLKQQAGQAEAQKH
jgi:preprotein translocase subunit SecB